ncbi:peptidoglycan-binding domain-containing protein [Paracoccus luteus]|uniref:peptidoglycan-binding domain-containing protein n=1 Tax=Paracoccus luteus TaxID=2508543 RepID=UPI0010705AD8|nr:peptidoglycan-binding protein [Paracoccus luteus]
MRRRISQMLGAAALAATTALSPLAAAAEPRAVVLTNGDYQQLPDVDRTDASAAIAAFKQAGYRMVEGRNLTNAQIRGALADLLRADARPGPRVVVLIGRFVHSRGDTWFLGIEAGPVNLLQADQVGVPMSVVIEAMAGGRPGSTLMLGTDQSMFPNGAGLQRSFGPMDPPEGVRVIVGYADGVRRAAEVLARPGSTLRDVMSTAPSLRQVRGEDQRPPDPHEESAWQDAARTNTAAAYREFLSKYPQGRRAAEARSRLAGTDPVVVPGPDGGATPVVVPPGTVTQPGDEEMAAWTRAKRANSAAAYREFLSKYPQSIFAGAARGRMGELQAPAPAPNTAAQAEAALALDRPRRAQIQRQLTLLSFDTGGIDGVFGDQTRRAVAAWQRSNGQAASGYLTREQLARLDQAATRRTATLEAEAARVRAATEAADREYWARSGAGGGRVGLQTYLRRFPDGIYADQARQALARLTGGNGGAGNGAGEAVAWTRARTANTMAAYREYLDKFPRGANAAAARQAHDALRARVQQDAAEEARLDLDGVAMRLVETRLQQMGLEPGAVDGRFDAGTRQAIRRYQQDRSLTASGYLNQGTIVRLLADTLLPQN